MAKWEDDCIEGGKHHWIEDLGGSYFCSKCSATTGGEEESEATNG